MRTYSVPLDPANHAVAGAWTFDPWTTAVLALLLGGVLLGARRARPWSWWRFVPLGAGLVVAVVAVDAWPGVYARSLLSVLVSQQLALLLVAPVLLAFGRPAEPLRALGLRLPAPLGAAYRRLSHPLLGPILVPVVTALLYFSPLLDLAVRSRLGADLIHLALLLLGAVVAAPLARDDLDASSLGVGLVVFVGLIELLVDAIPGIALRLMSGTLGPVLTLAGGRDWGPSAHHDQQLGGAILWAVAELVDLPYLLIVLRQWIRADAREAVRVDEDLDRAALERRVRRPVTAPEARAAGAEPDRDPPWWEQDPSVFDEHRARRLRRPR
ncbi:MAG: cytochrome c oxidase assembly protein [Mycobacteriales bacterium]